MVLPSLVLVLAAASSQWLFTTATQEIEVFPYQLTYSAGNWTQAVYPNTALCTGNTTYMVTVGVPGATASYSFKGITVSLYLTTASDTTIIQVILDGESTLYDATYPGFNCFTQIFRRTGLDWNMQHSLSIRATTDKYLVVRRLYYTIFTESELMSLSAASASPTTAQATSSTTTQTTSTTTWATSLTSTYSSSATKEKSGGDNNTGAIVGGVVGGIFGLGILTLLLLIYFRLRRQPFDGPQPSHPSMVQQEPYAGPQSSPSQPGYPDPVVNSPSGTRSQQQQQQPYPGLPEAQQPFPQQQFSQQPSSQQTYSPSIDDRPASPPPSYTPFEHRQATEESSY